MMLDDFARQATTQVVEHVAPSVTARLADLKATRSRRSRLSVWAVIAVLVAGAAVGAGWWAPQDPPSLVPASQVHNGVLVLLKGKVPLVQRPAGGLGSLPTDVAPRSPLAFVNQGRELVYRNQNDQYVAFDLRSRTWRVLHTCPKQGDCDVSTSPDGRRVAVATSNGIEVMDTGTGTSMLLDTGTAFGLQWSPDGEELLYGDVDHDLSTVHVHAGARGSKAVNLAAGHVPVDPRWSPDGAMVAYFDYVPGRSGDPFGSYTAMLAPADGSSRPKNLMVAANGCCGGALPPALVWAPDGSRLLVGALIEAETVPVHAFTPKGEPAEAPANVPDLVGQVAWQPVTSP